MFEILKSDLAARIGRIDTKHGSIETPAYVPVIHPARQVVPAKEIREMGFDLVITNAYITRNAYGDQAVRRGIHDIIKYDGAVMTDSGGYQVLEYGRVDVTASEMAAFERDIRTDFAIPLDKPTGLGMPKERAESCVRHTIKVSREALDQRGKDSGQVWVGPIQGSEHSHLVEKSAKSLVRMGFEMLALGSPVEFMESYEYGPLAKMIISAKKHIPHSIPLHLFGAGHPLTIPLAVALGCDTFDSASYILYAKHQRYIAEDGTRRLDELEYLPCCCPVCTRYTPRELLGEEAAKRTRELALHNLYAIKLEVDKTKQAIHEGRLWEYVLKKSRAHTRLYEAVMATVTDAENRKALGAGTAQFKQRAVFLYGPEDQHRPEILAYHRTVRDYRTDRKTVVILPESHVKPGYASRQYSSAYKDTRDANSVQFCQYNPILGIIPIEISDLYPAAHHETVRTPMEPEKCTEFAETWSRFFDNNGFAEIRYDKNDMFLRHFAKTLKGIRKRGL